MCLLTEVTQSGTYYFIWLLKAKIKNNPNMRTKAVLSLIFLSLFISMFVQWTSVTFLYHHRAKPNAVHFLGCCPASANNKKMNWMKAYKEPTKEWRWIWMSFELPFPMATFWKWITQCYTLAVAERYYFSVLLWHAHNPVWFWKDMSDWILSEIVFIALNKSLLHNTATYWL